MTGPEALDVARDGIVTLIQVASPLMLVGLVVGLAVGVIQALTQIQEATLAFVPKLLAVLVATILVLPFMGEALAAYMGRIVEKIVSG